MRKPPSLFWRSLIALALAGGFYAFALGLGLSLAFAPWLELKLLHTLSYKSIFFPAFGLVLLWSLAPKFQAFAEPGPRLLPSDHPDFFKMLEEAARKLGLAAPADVYALEDVTVYVASQGGRSYMALGLPLLQSLSRAQWEAVLLHEFGHYAGEDTRLAALLLKIRQALSRALRRLRSADGSPGLLQLPFRAYAWIFLRVTRAVSRAQEAAADALAAKLGSKRDLAQALCAIERASLAYGAYWNQEVLPLLEKGYLPPFLEGFRLFKESPRVRAKVEEAMLRLLKEEVAKPGDSHPPLMARLRALEEPAVLADAPGRGCALDLLSRTEELGQALLKASVEEEWQERLSPVSWNLAGEMAFVPFWRKEMLLMRGKIPQRLLGVLILDDAALREAGQARLKDVPIEDPRCLHAGAIVYETELLMRLFEEGWDMKFEPGREIEMQKGEFSLKPFGLLLRARENGLKRLEIARQLEQYGVAQWTLGA